MPTLNQYAKIATHANFAAFPVTGEPLTLYLALDTNAAYTWMSGNYVSVASSQAVYQAFDLAALNALPATDKKVTALYVTTSNPTVYLWNGVSFTPASTNYVVVADLVALSALTSPNEITLYLTANTGTLYRYNALTTSYVRVGVDCQQVNSLAALNALPATDRSEARLYLTLDTGVFYRYQLLGDTFVVASSGVIEATNLAGLNALPAASKRASQLYMTTVDSALYRYDTGSSAFTKASEDYIEVLNVAALNALPASRKTVGKLYMTTDNHTLYRWNTATFVPVSGNVRIVPTFSDLSLLPATERQTNTIYMTTDNRSLYYHDGGFQNLDSAYLPVANLAALNGIPSVNRTNRKLYYTEDTNTLYVYQAIGDLFKPVEVKLTPPEWQPSTFYTKGEIVQRADVLFKATQNHSSQLTFYDPSNFHVPLASDNLVSTFDGSAVLGVALYAGPKIQRLVNISSGTFNVFCPNAQGGQTIHLEISSNVNTQISFFDSGFSPVPNTFGANGVSLPNSISVPAGATYYFKLTCFRLSDTLAMYSWLASADENYPFRGASPSLPGNSGLVPRPAAAQESFYLKGDGTWADPSLLTPNVDMNANVVQYVGVTSVTHTFVLGGTATTIQMMETYTGASAINPIVPPGNSFSFTAGQKVRITGKCVAQSNGGAADESVIFGFGLSRGLQAFNDVVGYAFEYVGGPSAAGLHVRRSTALIDTVFEITTTASDYIFEFVTNNYGPSFTGNVTIAEFQATLYVTN